MVTTRKPTGRPAWPTLLIAGREKTGKSWMSAVASASPYVAATYWIGFGELDPDEYGAIDGADFDIVVHDGTIRGMLHELEGIVAEEDRTGPPTLIVLDSATRLWEAHSERAQNRANARRNGNGDAVIGMDLWNKEKGDWQKMLALLRRHHGPAIVTARFEEVAVVVKGKPVEGQKEWRVKAERGLPYDVDGVIEMRERGDIRLTGIRSVRMELDKPRTYKELTFHELWTDLGLGEGNVGEQKYSDARPGDEQAMEDTSGRDWLDELETADTVAKVAALGTAARAAGADPETLAALRARHKELASA